MATYFGYVEREADSYVNWADVGRNMSATIDNIQRVRDEKKALIEKAYREDLDYIQAIPSGEHKTLRDWSIGFGNDAAENLKLKYSLLKQGKSSVKDFTSFRENITNDTESLYTTINNIQTAYKEKMDRFKAGDNQDLEMADMAQLERFGNLSDTQSFINGLTGSVGVGLTEEVEVDGKKVRALKKGDDAYLTVQQLVSAVNRKYDNYDVIPDIAKWVEGFGEKIKSLRQFGSEIKAGSIIEVMDITNEELMKQAKALGYTEKEITSIQTSIDDFKKAENLYLKSLMVDNPYNTLATLNKKLNYQPTFSKEEAAANPNMVYCERDSSGAAVPKFTPDQETAVFDYMKGQARIMYDEKVKLNTYQEPQKQQAYNRAPTPEETKGAANRQNVANFGSIVGRVYGQDYASRESALSSLTDWLPEDGYAFFGKDSQGDYVLASKGGQDRKKIYLTKNGSPVPIDDFTADFSSYVIGTRAIGTDLDAARARARQESRGGTFSTDFGDANNRNFVFWNDPYKIQEEYRKYKRGKEAWDKTGIKKEYPDQAKLNELKVALDKFSFLDESGQQGGQQGQTTTKQGTTR